MTTLEVLRLNYDAHHLSNIICRPTNHETGYCLSEAHQKVVRDQLRSACTINLLRDERKKRLQLSWRAATSDGTHMDGGAGISTTHGSKAIGITEGTRSILKRLCTSLKDPPWYTAAMKPVAILEQFDEQLFNHIRNITEAITIDSASDELVSASDMSASSPPVVVGRPHGCESFMPNLKHVLRDKAHASRRLLTRPWAADEHLNDIIFVFIKGPGCIAKLIQGSNDFRSWYNSYSAANTRKPLTSSFTNMRCRAHRFESQLTPLSRLVIDIDALISTATRIDIDRRETSAHQALQARTFLITLSNKNLLLVALMADAGDEVLVLIRFFDSEEVDASCISVTIQRFIDRIAYLFIDGNVWTSYGHTTTMLDYLKQQRAFMVMNVAHSIGGCGAVTENLKTECLTHLRRWVVMAFEVLKAEFPSHEIMQSMLVFDTSRPPSPPATIDNALRRLASAFSLCDAQLRCEYDAIHPYARSLQKKMPGVGLPALYRTILQRRHRECPMLMHVLARFSAWSVSTSGLEQRFSKAAKLITERQGSLTEQNESNLFLLITAKLDVAGENALCLDAQRIWSLVYGHSRRHAARQRLDIGMPHKFKYGKDSCVRHKVNSAKKFSSMKKFLTARRSALSCVIPGSGNASIHSYAQQETDPALPVSEKFINELAWLSQKQRKRKLDAVHELLPEEFDANFIADIAVHDAKKVASLQRRHTQHQQNHAKLNRKLFDLNVDLRGQLVPIVICLCCITTL